MKQLLSTILFFGTLPLFAQNASLPVLQDLEGVWFKEGREISVFTEWQISGQQTYLHRTWQVRCGVTAELSRASVYFENGLAKMALQTDSLMQGQIQVFGLSESNEDAIVWKNENPDGIPQQISWRFYDDQQLTLGTDGKEGSFRRKPAAKMRLSTSLMAGVGANTRKNREFNPDRRQYQAGIGAEMAFSANLRGAAPLGFRFEMGIAHRQIQINEQWMDNNSLYGRQGAERNTALYCAFVPELLLGKANQAAVFAGVFRTVAHRTSFQGATTGWDSAIQLPPDVEARQNPSLETGLLAGFSWRLPERFLTGLQPAFYCRGMLGLGYTKVKALSCGVSFQWGKKQTVSE